jgi:hypothetical protein
VTGVCFASYEGFDGCVQSCRCAADVLGATWATIAPDGRLPAAVHDAAVLVLSSWHDRYAPLLDATGRLVIMRWHSPMLQTELGHEQTKLAHLLDLLDRHAIAGVWVDDPGWPPILDRPGVVFVPNVLSDDEYTSVTPARLRGTHISLFGAAEGRKNILTQSAGFKHARRMAGAAAWTLHFNGQTCEDTRYERWLDAARIPYVDHGWLPRHEYLSLVAAMDAGLCASLSESYCYVAADHVALGVPIVASPTVACLGVECPRTRPDRAADVGDALRAALSNRAAVAAEQRRSLIAQARVNENLLRAVLAAIDVTAAR